MHTSRSGDLGRDRQIFAWGIRRGTMKKTKNILGIVFYCMLPACNSSEGDQETASSKVPVDSNLECAAMIGAANSLIGRGEIENDPTFSKRALVSSMAYLNAYAIPYGLKEPEAFKEVKSHRTALIESLSSEKIMGRAKQCIDRSPW